MANEKILIIDDDDDLVHALRLPWKRRAIRFPGRRTGTRACKDQGGPARPDYPGCDDGHDNRGVPHQPRPAQPRSKSEYKAFIQVPILMLTSIHSTTNLRFGPDKDYLPVDAFIEKPIEPAELLKKVRKHLAKKPA